MEIKQKDSGFGRWGLWTAGEFNRLRNLAGKGDFVGHGEFNRLRNLDGTVDSAGRGGIWPAGQDLAVRGNIPNLASGITAASELRRRQRFRTAAAALPSGGSELRRQRFRTEAAAALPSYGSSASELRRQRF